MQITSYNISDKYNLKLAVVADVHGSLDEKGISSLIKEKPDYILSPGDFFDRHSIEDEIKHDKHMDLCLGFLDLLNSIAPVIISLGNHEFHLTDEDKKRIKNSKTLMLDNEYIVKDDIAFGGLTSRVNCIELHHDKKKTVNTEFIEKFQKLNEYKILLSHHPEDYNKYLRDKNIDLVISGHAHGGQIRIFGKGLFAPGQGFFPKYTGGKVDKMIISRGMTNTVSVPRLFNKTELVYIHI